MDGDLSAPGLVPELDVSELDVSIEFYEVLGFEVQYARPEEGFSYLAVGKREQGHRQFSVEDPDGYLWRPFESLGDRPR